jgi:hypothetical protein
VRRHLLRAAAGGVVTAASGIGTAAADGELTGLEWIVAGAAGLAAAASTFLASMAPSDPQ